MSPRFKTAIGMTAIALGALAFTFSPPQSAAQSSVPAMSAMPPIVTATDREPLLPDASLPGTAITYQGQLKSGGASVNGACDFQFTLHDALALGARIGTTQTVSAITVTNGLFTAAIDFGAGAFTGDARFLASQVRCPSGVGTYSALSPRQALTAVPYALYSAAPWATGISNTLSYASGNVGIGTAAPAHRLSLVGGPGWTSNGWTGALEIANGSAIGWQANDPAPRFGIGQSTGTLYFFHTLSSPGTVTSTAVYDMVINDYGEVGIGTTNPTAKLHVVAPGAAIGGYSPNNTAVRGASDSYFGVWGTSGSAWGVYGASSSSAGILGSSNTGDGVVGSSNFGYAGYFYGNVKITGTCCAAPANFMQIDHPLDPANQTLQQALVESPDMKTIYDGNATTDEKGDATISLPAYVGALNGDFRYQLTVIGQFAQAIVSAEIKDHQFSIKTDKPNVKVSWQVTGIRKDPYAAQHRMQPETAKPAGEIGKYLHPAEYGQPKSMGVDYERRQTMERQGSEGKK